MPKLSKPLTDTQVKNAQAKIKPKGFGDRTADEPTDKPYPLADGGSLYLLVNPDGGKLWRMQCTFEGKPRLLSFGKYPEVSLLDARLKRSAARKMLNEGIDPAAAKRATKVQRAANAANTFESIAREWHANKLDTWHPRTAVNVLHRLSKDVSPIVGNMPITSLKAAVMLDLLRRIEKRGAVNMAKRQGQVCSQIFRYAIACGKAEADPMPGLRGALKPRSKGHHAAITVDELPAFLQAFSQDRGAHVCADQGDVQVDDDDLRTDQ